MAKETYTVEKKERTPVVDLLNSTHVVTVTKDNGSQERIHTNNPGQVISDRANK
jgi:hypothetical protein